MLSSLELQFLVFEKKNVNRKLYKFNSLERTNATEYFLFHAELVILILLTIASELLVTKFKRTRQLHFIVMMLPLPLQVALRFGKV